MRTKEELKDSYIKEKTNNWDSETIETYIYYIENDFEIFYEGYLTCYNEIKNKLQNER